MNTTTDTAATFAPNAVYSVPSLGIEYKIQFNDERTAARIQDGDFVTGFLTMTTDPENRFVNKIIDPDGYAIPAAAVSWFFVCSSCNADKTHSIESLTTGYGTDRETGAKTCFACIGIQDEIKLLDMKPGERTYLYLSGEPGSRKVSNWPGSFSRPVTHSSVSRHNWGLKRYDVWFTVQGERFHGYQIGENTQICHVRKLMPAKTKQVS